MTGSDFHDASVRMGVTAEDFRAIKSSSRKRKAALLLSAVAAPIGAFIVTYLAVKPAPSDSIAETYPYLAVALSSIGTRKHLDKTIITILILTVLGAVAGAVTAIAPESFGSPEPTATRYGVLCR